MDKSSSGLGSSADPTFSLPVTVEVWRAAWAIATGAVSIVFGAFTIWMLFGRPWRPTLGFLIVLLMSDWAKAFWQVCFSAYWLARRPTGTLQDSAWCQAQGWLYSWALEMSDCTLFIMIAYVVLGVATRLRRDTPLVRFGAALGYTLWVSLPIVAASLAFINGSGYTNQNTTCYLPVRPFWYRLGLSWVPRYLMLFISCTAVLWLFLYIKAKNRSFLILLRRPDEDSSSVRLQGISNRTNTELSLPKREDVIPGGDFGVPNSPRRVRSPPPFPELQTNNLIRLDDVPESQTDPLEIVAQESVTHSAEEVLRRLRRLWAYPLVYFLYWIFPFVYHAMSYKTYFVRHPVVWIAGLSSTIVSLQCTFMSIAVWLFERPRAEYNIQNTPTVWQHLMGTVGEKWRGAATTRPQRQSNSFAKQRLAREQQEQKATRARHSANPSFSNVNYSERMETGLPRHESLSTVLGDEEIEVTDMERKQQFRRNRHSSVAPI